MKNNKSRVGFVLFIVGIVLIASSITTTGIALLAVGVLFIILGRTKK
jgi:Zn-dependent membrane protease YugP